MKKIIRLNVSNNGYLLKGQDNDSLDEVSDESNCNFVIVHPNLANKFQSLPGLLIRCPRNFKTEQILLRQSFDPTNVKIIETITVEMLYCKVDRMICICAII